MTESPNQMVISDPSDHPITDSFGNAWRITPSGQVSANGVLDHDNANVMQVVYVNQMIWRQTRDLFWQSKKHPGDNWSQGSHRSPMSGGEARELEEIERDVAYVLGAVQSLRGDFDTYKGQAAGGQASILAAIAALKKDLDAGVLTLPAQVLAQIAAGFVAQEPAQEAAFGVLIANITALFAAATDAANARQQALVVLLNQILAAINKQSEPTRIVLDVADVIRTPQAIPQRPGP